MSSATQKDDLRPLVGRGALVTGGATGIGRAVVVALAGADAEVTIPDRGIEAKAVADQIGRGSPWSGAARSAGWAAP